MTPFDNPSSQPSRWQREAFRRLPALLQGRRIPLFLTGVPRGFPRIPFVAAEGLRGAIPRSAPLQDASRPRRGQQRPIWRLGAADDEGQRDATPVHQQAARAPLFFPDPWDWAPRPLAPTAPSSASRQGSARSRRYRASRHTPSARLATAFRTALPPATLKNTGESHWDSQTVLWATPSIASRFGGRTRFRQRLVWGARASVRPRRSVDIPDSGLVAAWESTAQLAATRYLRLPMIERVVSVSCLDSSSNPLIFVNHYLWTSSYETKNHRSKFFSLTYSAGSTSFSCKLSSSGHLTSASNGLNY